MSNLLVLYATVEGHTGRIAQRMAGRLREAGFAVDVQEAAAAMPRLQRYAGFMVGASVHYGHHPAFLRRLLRAHGETLARLPGAFFSVSLSAKEKYAARFLREAGWQPQLVATFAGALQYSKYGAFKRLVVKAFAAIGGHDTDSSRDYEYTDWQAVDRFSESFARLLSADLPGSRAPSSRGG